MKPFLILVAFYSLINTAYGQITAQQRQTLGKYNQLTNGGFEAGAKTGGWSTNSVGTLTATGSNGYVEGSLAGCVTLSSQTLNLTVSLTTNVANMKGQGVVFGEAYASAGTGLSVCSVVDSVEQDCKDISNLASWNNPVEIPFVFGATNYGLKYKSSGNVTGTYCLDAVEIGKAPKGYTPSIPSFFAGSVAYSACAPSAAITATGSATAFSYTGCTSATITGNAALPTTAGLGIKIPVGAGPMISFVLTGDLQTYRTSAGSAVSCEFYISDGTTHTSMGIMRASGASSNVLGAIAPSWTATVALPGSSKLSTPRDYYLYARASETGANCTFAGIAGTPAIAYSSFNSAANIASSRCDDLRNCTTEFSALVTDGSSTTTVSQENLDFVSSNCTNPTTGNYVCTLNTGVFSLAPNPKVQETASAVKCRAHTVTSTSVSVSCFNTTDGTALDASFWLFAERQGTDFVAAKVNKVVGTFESVMKTPGVTKPKKCYYGFGGASATLAAPTKCTSGTCVEVIDSCGTGSAPTWATTALYQNMTFANGTWAANTPLDCRCKAFETATSSTRQCTFYQDTGDQTWSTNSSGGAVLNIETADASGTNGQATTYVQLECEGQAP